MVNVLLSLGYGEPLLFVGTPRLLRGTPIFGMRGRSYMRSLQPIIFTTSAR
jgi:hypothetical protein